MLKGPLGIVVVKVQQYYPGVIQGAQDSLGPNQRKTRGGRCLVPGHRPEPIPVTATQRHRLANLRANFIAAGVGRPYLVDEESIPLLLAVRTP